MEFIREDCIYARQSVDRKDSISIESQIDFCKYELKGGSCRVFKDKGYSGKNTEQTGVSKAAGRDPQGKGSAGHRVQAGPYKPLYSGLCNDDGAVSRVRCGVCILHGKV